ncbi:alpha/beta hydrolase family protein [Marinoscillum furvescens]|uniref:Alpha/beta hydrolase family protein n=1 Tax=Marinoscillum furvescens DSM 4134 TaxID=1122208 RepID=A0A3D9L011_MARFU|nr:alpha/beta hydrolase [Marinoscillum furvescens]RED93873.1 alpha/beta hydrolase family protein [Marinoscillum furvescens DSM 4134]
MKTTQLYVACFVLMAGLWSCSDGGDETPKPEESPSTLVADESFGTWRSGDLRGFIGFSGLDISSEAMTHDVNLFKVRYTTMYQNQEIEASTLVILPANEEGENEAFSVFSFQHGTIASDAEAPTNQAINSQTNIFLSSLASTGQVVVVPDLIGFGASADYVHPYYVEELTATATIDAIYAARELATANDLALDGELYLGGYSQGGYSTMATHKHIEEKGVSFFELKASFPSSGGYDVKAFQEYFFGLETYHQPFYMAFVAYGYAEAYGWSDALPKLFNEPYASKIPQLFDGSQSGGLINKELNDTLSVFLTADILANIDNYPDFKDALVANSLTDWTPTIPMYMYHGDADITVPFENSQLTYDQLIANGASKEVVTFTAFEGATHGTGVSPYIEAFIEVLLKLETQ